MSIRLLLPLALVAALSLGSSGCKRIEAKLDRLARAAGLTSEPPPAPKPKPKPTEPVLTPEQQAIEASVQSNAIFEIAKPKEAVPKAVPFELNKSAVVSILGYHDFKERGGTPMLISSPKFREQMKAIKESGIPVIPLSDVLAWRKGEKNIPEESIVITMDDGWEGVYTYAYPALKEYKFPFTIYLYKKYVNIGGRSMSWDQIREMMKHGCEVGSHSVSHESLRSKRGRNDAAQAEWILSELKDSKEFLEKNLNVPVTSFAYPFGAFDESHTETALQVGYESLITVNNQKVTWDTPMGKLGRYIIHGDSDANFKLATSFRGRGDVASNHFLMATTKDDKGNLMVELKPVPEELVKDRRPVIQANLSRVGAVVTDTVKMRISGLGTVPAVYDPATMTVTYQLPYRLRRSDCAITLSFKRTADQPEEVVSWRFKVDLEAAYLPGA